MKDGKQNKLAGESSPYLLQHAYNPVDWYPWKDEALKKAVDEDKLMIISIGYAACHWCHVMEHESFEDSIVADHMNSKYVSVKVDREERPDIDNVYMSACQVITQWQGGGSCGWPLNIIALPDGRPVFAGTYYPRETWINILEHFSKIWVEDRPAMEDMAGQLTAAISSMEDVPAAEAPVDFSLAFLDELFPLWEERLDFKEGGRVGAPKFPMPINYQFLLRYHYLNGNEKALEAVEVSLEKMAKGGIYDQLGGGFARYSVDGVWLVPHFEKMLYDNGQLVTLYSEAHRYRPDPIYEQVIRESLDFIAREMTSTEGGFYSSLDADSEGEEGKFYVWTAGEIDSVLTLVMSASELEFFKSYYNIKKNGNWEHGKNILHVKASLSEKLEKWQKLVGEPLDEAGLRDLLLRGKSTLMAERDKRIRPGLDNKILTSWNALMLKGYIEAYKTLGDEAYLNAALRNARFLEKEMLQEDGRLLRNHKDGKSVINAFLDDYALLADAWVALYQVTFDRKWLDYALKLTQYANDHFSDPESSLYFYTSDLDPSLITRKKELNDNVIAASNSVMARNLLVLSHYYTRPDFYDRASSMAATMEPQVRAYPVYNANWAMMLTELAHPSFEVAIAGKNLAAVAGEFNQSFLPDVLLLGSTKESSSSDLSLLENKLVKGQTTIYVCRDKVCKLPVTTFSAALDQLKSFN